MTNKFHFKYCKLLFVSFSSGFLRLFQSFFHFFIFLHFYRCKNFCTFAFLGGHLVSTFPLMERNKIKKISEWMQKEKKESEKIGEQVKDTEINALPWSGIKRKLLLCWIFLAFALTFLFTFSFLHFLFLAPQFALKSVLISVSNNNNIINIDNAQWETERVRKKWP